MFNLLADRLTEEMLWRPEVLLKSIGEPKTQDDLYLWGVAHYEKGDYLIAESAFRRNLEKSVSYHPAMFGLAQSAFESGRIEEGKKWFRRAYRYHKMPESIIQFQKSLRSRQITVDSLGVVKLWCLHQVVDSASEVVLYQHPIVLFEIGRLLFEQSKFEASMTYFESSMRAPKMVREASEYLSYVYETLYKGDELLLRTLQMAKSLEHRADILFNLAMACQHDQKRPDLALHLFYLSTLEDPTDPGLRFSMEQLALEILQRKKSALDERDKIIMMFSHLYQGAHGVAKKIFFELKGLDFPEDFFVGIPEVLWREWLLVDGSPLDRHFKAWATSASPIFLDERRNA